MSVNTDLQGSSYRLENPVEVGQEKIAEFARAVGATHPSHFDVQAAKDLGYGAQVAPPTFPVTIAQRAEALYIASEEGGIDFSRVVHGQEQFTYTRPVVAGDLLNVECFVDGIREAGGHAMITTRTELTDARTDEPVVTVTSTIVVRGGEDA